jgi:hypothetical protein
MADWALPVYPTEPEKDIVQDFEYLREYATDHYPAVPYRRLTTQPQELDDVHHEIAVHQRTYAAAVILHGFVTQAGKHDQPTTKGVIDWERDIVLHVPSFILEDLGWVVLGADSDMLTVSLGIGDVFKFHEYEFEAFNAQRSDERYHNTDIPIYWDISAKRFKPDSGIAIDWDMDPRG